MTMDLAETTRLNGQGNLETADAGDESGLAKLSREAQVLLGGTIQGISTGVEEARNDPWNTGLKLAGSVAVGVGLAYLQRGAGMARLAGEALAVGMGTAFLTDVADPGRLDKIGGALRDTWNSSKHIEHNRTLIGQNLGRFAFDTGLMMVGGMAGSLWGKSAFGSKFTQTEASALKRSLDSQAIELFGRKELAGSRNSSEPLGVSPKLETRISDLPGSRSSRTSESEIVVQATDPEAPSHRIGAQSERFPARHGDAAGQTESKNPALDTRGQAPPAEARHEGPVVPEVKSTSADPATVKDIPARDVLARWDVRDLGDPELLARRQVEKRGDGRIVRTTNAYGDVTGYAYGVRGLREVLTSVKFPDGTVADLYKGDVWFVSGPGKPGAVWSGRLVLQPDGSLVKIPESGGSETIFLNGLREISIIDGSNHTNLVQDLRGRTLKTTTGFSGRITAYEYDGGDVPVRALELREGTITEVPVASSKK